MPTGLVEFSATLDIVKPVDIDKGNRRVLYEFSNRGNRGLAGFNYGRGTDMSSPSTPATASSCARATP